MENKLSKKCLKNEFLFSFNLNKKINLLVNIYKICKMVGDFKRGVYYAKKKLYIIWNELLSD